MRAVNIDCIVDRMATCRCLPNKPPVSISCDPGGLEEKASAAGQQAACRNRKMSAQRESKSATTSAIKRCQLSRKQLAISLVVFIILIVKIRSSICAVKVFNDQHKQPHQLGEVSLLSNRRKPLNETDTSRLPIKFASGRSIEQDRSSAKHKLNAIAKSQIISGFNLTDKQVRRDSENKTRKPNLSLKFVYDSLLTAKRAQQRENNRRLRGEHLQPATTTTTTTRRPFGNSFPRQFDDDEDEEDDEREDLEQVGVGSFTLAKIDRVAQTSPPDISRFRSIETVPITSRKFGDADQSDAANQSGRNQVVDGRQLQPHATAMEFSLSLDEQKQNNQTGQSDSRSIEQPVKVAASYHTAQLSLESTRFPEQRYLAASGPARITSSGELDNNFIGDDEFSVTEAATVAHDKPPFDSLGAPVGEFDEGSESKRKNSFAKRAESVQNKQVVANGDFLTLKTTNDGESERSVYRKKPFKMKTEMLRPILMTSGVRVNSELMLVANGSNNRPSSSALQPPTTPELLSSSVSLAKVNRSRSEWQPSGNESDKQLLVVILPGNASSTSTNSTGSPASTIKATAMRRLPANEGEGEGERMPDFYLDFDQDDPSQLQAVASPQRYYQSLADRQDALLADNQLSELPAGGDQPGGFFAGYQSAVSPALEIDRVKAASGEEANDYEKPTRREEVNDRGSSWLSNSYLQKKLSQFRATAASSGIHVTAPGERSIPLVINSRGLIMAAKPSSGGRPYNASTLSNQVDSSLNPIVKFAGETPQLQGSIKVFDEGDHHTIVNNRSDLNRLKKPILVSGGGNMWRKNFSSSSMYGGQGDPDTYNQVVNDSYGSSKQNMSLQTADYGDQLYLRGHPQQDHRNNGHSPAAYPDEAVAAEDMFDEPLAAGNQAFSDHQVSRRPERHKQSSQQQVAQQQQQQQQQYQNSSIYNSSNNNSSFYHNPPYKHQMASVELAQSTNNTGFNNGRISGNRTGGSTTRKPSNKNGQSGAQSQSMSQPYVGHTEVERIYLLSPSQQSERVGLAASASSAIYTTTTPPYDTTLAAELAANSSSLSPPINSAYSQNNTFKVGGKLRDKLQHMIIGKIIKNQLMVGGGGQQQQASSGFASYASPPPPTPPPLLSSTVANNVANLLAQKLNFLVRPHSSGSSSSGSGNNQHSGFGLNSLFGIRLGGGGGGGTGTGSSGINKFKQRINPFLNPVNSHVINRRTTGIGSLLFSGFIYGLSVLPALMALTGINPMSADAGQTSASSPSSTVANRHGNNERKVRPVGNHQTPMNFLPADQAAMASSYAYLVPLVTAAAAAASLDSTDDSTSGDLMESIPTGSHNEAQQSAIKALYTPPPSLIGPPPASSSSSLSSLSSDYHPLLESFSNFGNAESAGTSQPTVISLSQLTTNDLLGPYLNGNYKQTSNFNQAFPMSPASSGAEQHHLWQPDRSSGFGTALNLASRQVRDISALSSPAAGGYELRGGGGLGGGGHLNLTEVRRPFGEEMAAAYEQFVGSDRGVVSQSGSSNHVKHGHYFDQREQQLRGQQQQQQQPAVQHKPSKQFAPENNGYKQQAQYWPQPESGQPSFSRMSLLSPPSSSSSSFGASSASAISPNRFVATPNMMGNQQSATGVNQLHFTQSPQSDHLMRSQRHRHGQPLTTTPEYDSGMFGSQKQPAIPTLRPSIMMSSTSTKSSPANSATDTDDLIIRDPFGAQIGDNSLLESLDNFMSNRRRRTPQSSAPTATPTTTTEATFADTTSTSKPFKRGGSSMNRLSTKSRRIATGGSRLYPTFAKESHHNQQQQQQQQQSWQPNLNEAARIQVGYTMNYSPLATSGATRHASQPGSGALDNQDWRAIVPPKVKAPAKWVHQQANSASGETPTSSIKFSRKTGSNKSKTSDLLSGNSQRVYALVKRDNNNNNRWPLAATGTIKQAKPKKKKPPKGGKPEEKVSSLFGNDSASELLMAHAMALGNGVLNEPAN